MMIIANIYSEYNKILDIYNEVAEEKKTFEMIITEAIQNALKNADWTKLHPFRFKQAVKDEGYFWKPVFCMLDYDLYKELEGRYMRNGITIDDIANFALLFSQRLLIAKLKKAILDKKWNSERIVKVVESVTNAESLYVNDDWVKFDICPVCEHENFAIFLNTDTLPHGNCFRCNFTGDIWTLLDEVGGTLVDTIEEVWEILEEKESEINTKKIQKQQIQKEEINTREIEKILEEAKTNANMYMQKQGFSKTELEELEIYYRSGKTLGGSEADDFRFRVVYVIRDINGNIVGLQGRSIWDDEEERKRKVLQDEHWKKLYWDSNAPEKVKDSKLKKLSAKVISTRGFQKSEHLYLLHKYAKNPSAYRKLIIVEGPKDAARVYCRKIRGIAVVATFGNNISRKQMELIKEIFGENIEILLAFDADAAGIVANVKAWKQLKQAGFEKVHFVAYTGKDKKRNIWKDFGEMVALRTNPKYYEKLTHEIEVMLNRIVATPLSYLQEVVKKGITNDEIEQLLREEKRYEAEKIQAEANTYFLSAVSEQQKRKEEVRKRFLEDIEEEIVDNTIKQEILKLFASR